MVITKDKFIWDEVDSLISSNDELTQCLIQGDSVYMEVGFIKQQ